MSDISSKSLRQTEEFALGAYKALGPLPNYIGDEIIVMRHAETIAEVFPDWVAQSMLGENCYDPFDVNVPIELARRPQMQKSNDADPPLSEIARVCSKMMARELCDRKICPSVIFCSPDIASIETACLIKKFIGEKCGPIRIEPELSTMHAVSHLFFSKESLAKLGYDIDKDAEPLKTISTKVTLPDLRARIKRAFYELTNVAINPLFIVDSLAAKIIASHFYLIQFDEKLDVEVERAASFKTMPPLANITLYRMGTEGIKMYDISSLSLRPLTYTGFSNNIDVD
ncbi:unnamed protein product [Caenorhabditis bovis]|uniref:Uncharacterized protein n=1 Tax=Caenorhabditis bovis TaxID=2654633 RepID=A0A8S1EDJ9_9PELO|nr:unnamed protein product [Caenorhabditis bovis]